MNENVLYEMLADGDYWTGPYTSSRTPRYEVRRRGFKWVACEVDPFWGNITKVVGGPWLSKKRALVALELHKALKG